MNPEHEAMLATARRALDQPDEHVSPGIYRDWLTAALAEVDRLRDLKPDPKEETATMRLTPLHIDIVLHYHARASDMTNLEAPAVRQYVNELVESGILAPRDIGLRNMLDHRSYRLTEKGGVWLDALLSLPFPVQKWAMP